MHELSLAIRLIALVEEETKRAACTSVSTVTIQLGALSCVEPSSLQLAFLAARRDTIAASAQLIIEPVPAHAVCLTCQTSSEVTQRASACPFCGEFALVVSGGDELRLTRLEVV
jgi:hydrogenase nickel incorporation protein HypA/HybF